MMQYFFAKNKREEDLQLQKQQEMMQRIDEVFPQIEKILSVGLELKQVVVGGDEPSVVAEVTRHQTVEDKILQVEIDNTNENGGEIPPLDGGFVK
ncbi:hypothetical protein AGMMS4956_19710 [Bacteroidia bacterium]|nr:hypothetical protein AGMMS4956_19710 [Bacteroidia bacterium]